MEQFLLTITNTNTRRAYAKDLARFGSWLGDRGLALGELGVKDLLSYRDSLAPDTAQVTGPTLAPATVNRLLAAVRAFLRWAAQMELVSPEVYAAAKAVQSVKQPEPLPELITDEQFEDLLCRPNPATVEGARDIAFFRLLRFAGLRVSEAVGLDVQQVQLGAGKAFVTGKGGKDRVVLFDPQTAGALVHYLGLRGSPERGPVFTNAKGRRITDRRMRQLLAEYGSAIGRPDLHPHLLRHSFATWLLDETGDMDAVRGLLGHSNMKTTQRYTRLATKRYERVYASAIEQTTSSMPERLKVPA
jgi:site-specific recombinase XerD